MIYHDEQTYWLERSTCSWSAAVRTDHIFIHTHLRCHTWTQRQFHVPHLLIWSYIPTLFYRTHSYVHICLQGPSHGSIWTWTEPQICLCSDFVHSWTLDCAFRFRVRWENSINLKHHSDFAKALKCVSSVHKKPGDLSAVIHFPPDDSTEKDGVGFKAMWNEDRSERSV